MGRFGTAKTRPNEGSMPDPLAFFITWTTYGQWLPGDERGWIRSGHGWQPPNPKTHESAESRLTESICWLVRQQRDIVEQTITDHCRIRNWDLHRVSCRSNHVHVIVSADRDPEAIRDQFKAWCTRKLKEQERLRGHGPKIREKWWTEKGSIRFVGDSISLEAAIEYVDSQDKKHADNI